MKLHPSIFVGPVLILVVIAYFAGLMVVVPPASAQLPPIVFTNDVDPGTPGVQPVLVTPDSVNASARYTIGFYTDTGLFIEELGAQRIVITFPAGTKIPAAMASSAVFVNGLKSFGVTVTGQTVKIATPEAIPPESDVTLVFEAAAGIINPSIGGTYGTTFSKRPLSVSTSQQTFPVVPVAGYTISPILSVDKATASAGD